MAAKYNLKDGSTLLMSLLQNGRLSIGNVGDSCGYVMKTNGMMAKVTIDQNADRQDEINRIINDNGLITNRNGISRVDGQISVSRAIGDRPYKKFIIPDPECFHHEIQEEDDLLILSSDGLFLVYTEEQLAKEVHEMRNEGYDLSDITKKITDESCINYNCRDNITLVIVDLKKHYKDNQVGL